MKSFIFLLGLFIALSNDLGAQSLTATPNPFVQSTILQFTLNTADTTSLSVMNIWGTTVKTFLLDTVLSSGQYAYTLDGDSLNAGPYFAILLRNGQRTAVRMVKAASATSVIQLPNNSISELYPNPAYNRIIFDKVLIGSEILISDIAGREHLVTVDQNQIDISTLPAGIYFVRFKSKGNDLEMKFIKE